MKDSLDKYNVVIHWSDDDAAYIAEMPALPGCMADGITREEAISNLCVVAELWMAKARKMGRSIPQPEREPLVAASAA